MSNLFSDIASKNILCMLARRGISTDPSHYITTRSSYRRNNSVEQEFRTRYLLSTLRAFDCRCAICGSDCDGIEFDHFYLPKCLGGNFILTRSQDNVRIINAVPLCTSCNRRKNVDNVSTALLGIDLKHISKVSASLSVSLLGASLPVCGDNTTPTRLNPDTDLPLILSASSPGSEGWNLCMRVLETGGGVEELQAWMDTIIGWDDTYEE